MQCEEFEDRINAVLDERRRPAWDAELSLHCESCAPCRKLAETYDHLLDGFYALTAPDVPDDLALRVMVELQNERVPRRRRLTRGTLAMATAAAIIIAVAPLLRTSRESSVATTETGSGEARPALAGRTTSAAPPARLESLPLVPGLLSLTGGAAGDPYVGLARGTGQSLANVMLFVPGVGGGKGIMDVPPQKTKSEPSWTEPVSEGLRPITNSVTETFDLLIETLPVSQLARS